MPNIISVRVSPKDFIFYNELQVPNQVGEFSMNDIFEKPDERRQEHFFDMIKNSH